MILSFLFPKILNPLLLLLINTETLLFVLILFNLLLSLAAVDKFCDPPNNEFYQRRFGNTGIADKAIQLVYLANELVYFLIYGQVGNDIAMLFLVLQLLKR